MIYGQLARSIKNTDSNRIVSEHSLIMNYLERDLSFYENALDNCYYENAREKLVLETKVEVIQEAITIGLIAAIIAILVAIGTIIGLVVSLFSGGGGSSSGGSSKKSGRSSKSDSSSSSSPSSTSSSQDEIVCDKKLEVGDEKCWDRRQRDFVSKFHNDNKNKKMYSDMLNEWAEMIRDSSVMERYVKTTNALRLNTDYFYFGSPLDTLSQTIDQLHDECKTVCDLFYNAFKRMIDLNIGDPTKDDQCVAYMKELDEINNNDDGDKQIAQIIQDISSSYAKINGSANEFLEGIINKSGDYFDNSKNKVTRINKEYKNKILNGTVPYFEKIKNLDANPRVKASILDEIKPFEEAINSTKTMFQQWEAFEIARYNLYTATYAAYRSKFKQYAFEVRI